MEFYVEFLPSVLINKECNWFDFESYVCMFKIKILIEGNSIRKLLN